MKKLIFLFILFGSFLYSRAQHDHDKHEHKPAKKTESKKTNTPALKDTVPKKSVPLPAGGHDHGEMASREGHDDGHGHGEEHSMSHAFSPGLPMNRNGSGTGWLPDASPMYGYMFHSNKWMFMLHGNVFLRYNKQDLLDKGQRGDSKFDIPNWTMLMGQKRIGRKGLFRFSGMISLDAAIAGGEGYPLLFQTGESYNDKPLVDRQHPHDLFSELSVGYTHMLSDKSDVFVYLGYPGEPALGPVAFMHRPSALNNPDATLTHHWTDATHITFGVATLGYRFGNWKVEASSFTGREPDENRYDFDKPRFDSWSGRISHNPSEKWALQVSHAFIKEPEIFHPGEDVRRTTASASYSTRGFGTEFLNLSAVWGLNKTKGHDGEHGILLEGSYNVRKWGPYFRYERVQKSVDELELDEQIFGHDAIYPVHAFTAGLNYNLFDVGKTKFAIGGHFSFFNTPRELENLYGQNPLSGQVYLRIFPELMGTREGRFFLPY